MPVVEVTIPDHVDVQISQLIDRGEFTDRENAVQELVAAGLTAHRTGGSQDDVATDDEMIGHDEEYVF